VNGQDHVRGAAVMTGSGCGPKHAGTGAEDVGKRVMPSSTYGTNEV